MSLDKPLLVISNKFQTEWGQNPVNYINLSSLSKIFELCKDKFQIVYNRPSSTDITNDASPQRVWSDWNLAEKMGIPLMQDFQKDYQLF